MCSYSSIILNGRRHLRRLGGSGGSRGGGGGSGGGDDGRGRIHTLLCHTFHHGRITYLSVPGMAETGVGYKMPHTRRADEGKEAAFWGQKPGYLVEKCDSVSAPLKSQ